MHVRDVVPRDYKGVKIVDSYEALLAEPFGDANAVMLPRTLSGNFNGLARAIHRRGAGVSEIASLYKLPEIFEKFPTEVAQLRADIESMKDVFGQNAIAFLALQLRVSDSNFWQDKDAPYKFHADGARSPHYGRFLCCYNTPTTEWIRNEDAVSLAGSGGPYVARDDAPIYEFRVGDIWRMASTSRQDGASGPLGGYFIHRTPVAVTNRKSEDPPRMLMVAG